MAVDSFHLIQEFHNYSNFDSCSKIGDSLSMNHWYNFYNDAYANLISTHAGLLGALITAAVTIFCVKYFFENVKMKNLEKEFEEKIRQKQEEMQNDFAADQKKMRMSLETLATISLLKTLQKITKKENVDVNNDIVAKACFLVGNDDDVANMYLDDVNDLMKYFGSFAGDELKKIKGIADLISLVKAKTLKDDLWSLNINNALIKTIEDNLK